MTTQRAAQVLAALSTQPSTRVCEVVLGPGVASNPSYRGPGSELKDRDLAKALRSGSPPTVVVVEGISATLLRSLRSAPPALLVVLGALDAEQTGVLAGLEGLDTLGPAAVLWVDPDAFGAHGRVVATAHSADELSGLCRALGPRPIPLACAPTPAWLWTWLESGALARVAAAGYVPARCLGEDWARFADRRHDPHVLVPVGVPAAGLAQLHAQGDDGGQANDLRTAQLAAAHALERATGPVFPSPRVLSLLLDGLEANNALEPAELPIALEATPEQLELWMQARRALPYIGTAPGMDMPQPGLPLDTPTAAFLAQQALLRAHRHRQVLGGTAPQLAPIDDEGLDRADQVLRSASDVLTDQESKVVLRGFGFEVTRQAVANSASGAAGYADRIGYPVVLKALSPDLRRRSDVGGLVLGLATAAAVRRAYAAVVDSVERGAPTARLDGVLVAEMVQQGLDIRCGGRRLHSGAVVLYGQIEHADTGREPVLAMHPLRPEDALALAHSVLRHVATLRRETDPNVERLAELFGRISQLFAQTEDRIIAVDLGPARLAPERGYVTLDARIRQRPHLEGV